MVTKTDPRYKVSAHVKKVVPLENVKKIPTEIKTQAVAAIYRRYKTVQQLANQYQVSRKTLYDWKNNLLGTDFQIQSTKLKSKVKISDSDIVALRAKVYELEIQNDILRQINYLLKKERGINQLALTNAEKVQVINALRPKYSLRLLL